MEVGLVIYLFGPLLPLFLLYILIKCYDIPYNSTSYGKKDVHFTFKNIDNIMNTYETYNDHMKKSRPNQRGYDVIINDVKKTTNICFNMEGEEEIDKALLVRNEIFKGGEIDMIKWRYIFKLPSYKMSNYRQCLTILDRDKSIMYNIMGGVNQYIVRHDENPLNDDFIGDTVIHDLYKRILHMMMRYDDFIGDKAIQYVVIYPDGDEILSMLIPNMIYDRGQEYIIGLKKCGDYSFERKYRSLKISSDGIRRALKMDNKEKILNFLLYKNNVDNEIRLVNRRLDHFELTHNCDMKVGMDKINGRLEHLEATHKNDMKKEIHKINQKIANIEQFIEKNNMKGE